jgi:RsmE family RNA methyltransferase
VALITDEPPPGFVFDPASEPFDRVVWAKDLGIEAFRGWLFRHDVVEVCTAVKGPFLHQVCEAGVADVVIVVCDRSVPRPAGQDSGRRTERLRKVAIEATRQTGRASPPKVDLVFSVDEAMQVLAADDMLVGDSPEMSVPLPESLGLVRPRYVLDETPGTLSLAKLLAAGQSAGGAVLAVGPEGSFSDREHALLSSVGFVRAGLGPRVLRAETAAITAVIVAQTVVGDMK